MLKTLKSMFKGIYMYHTIPHAGRALLGCLPCLLLAPNYQARAKLTTEGHFTIPSRKKLFAFRIEIFNYL